MEGARRTSALRRHTPFLASPPWGGSGGRAAARCRHWAGGFPWDAITSPPCFYLHPAFGEQHHHRYKVPEVLVHTLSRISCLFAAGLVAVTLLGMGSKAPPERLIEANKAIAKRYLEEVFGLGRLDVADEIIDANYVYHGRGPTGKGPNVVKEFVGVYRTAFPDLHLTLEDMIAEGDRVAVRVTATGTNAGSLMLTPPTGETIKIMVLTILRIDDGKIVEEWQVVDELGLLEQLGVMGEDE